MRSAKIIKLISMLAMAVGLICCDREKRQFHEPPSASSPAQSVRQSELQPGTARPPAPASNEYEENAYAISEGKRLYEWYNCKGCHADGGGDIGPPLMDDQWIYGSNPENIFASIVEGRPNGMPSFAGKVPTFQVWQIAAYVRSMSGQVSKDASPGRSDNMSAKEAEQSKEKEKPRSQPAERPQ